VEVNFADLGVVGAVKARDVWAGKDLGPLTGYRVALPAHGVMLLKVG